MYLSKFQKEIVEKISNEEIKTVLDFLIKFNMITSDTTPKKYVKIMGKVVVKEEGSDFFIDKTNYKIINREDTYKKLIDFRKVINLLSKAELIEIEQSASIGLGYVATDDRPKEILDIINSMRNNFIITYNEINKFEKDFLTPQERAQRRQLWIPIIVAVATVLLSAILNYFIYTKEREVYIKNAKAFQDTVKVKIIDKKDSLGIAKQKTIIDPIKKAKIKQ